MLYFIAFTKVLLGELLHRRSVLIHRKNIPLKRENTMNKISLTGLALLVVSGLILSACAAQGTSASLAGTSWKLVSYGPAGNQTSAAPGIETHLDFSRDGTVSGNLGCNSFSGNYEVKNGNLIFSQMISTMMACQEPQMTQETTALQVMNGTVPFQLTGNSLKIFDVSDVNAIEFTK
jgi:heat shock protein HslJ